MPYFGSHFEGQPGEVLVRLPSRILDEETIFAIRNRLMAIAADPGVRTLYLDMDEVECISSAFLVVLIQVHKKLKSRDSRLCLRNVDPQIYEVLHAMPGWYHPGPELDIE